MEIHRFMSRREYELLAAGKELYNPTNHRKKDKKRTNSIGFCFFTENPDDAVHWLSGIVDLDVCVTMEVPDGWGVKSWGLYLDDEATDMSKPMNYQDFMREAKFKKRAEICRCRYSTKDVRIIDATDKYYSMYPPRSEHQHLIKAMLAGVKI